MPPETKNDWDRLVDGFQTSPLGLDMKVEMKLRFEGTFEAFVAWAHETFKHVEKMPLVVTVDIGDVEEKPLRGLLAGQKTTPWVYSLLDYLGLTDPPLTDSPQQRDVIWDQLRKIELALLAGQKLEAIKLTRTVTGWGLKEARDFIEKETPMFRSF